MACQGVVGDEALMALVHRQKEGGSWIQMFYSHGVEGTAKALAYILIDR